MGSQGELSDEWRADRLSELAFTLTLRKSTKKLKLSHDNDSVLEHDSIVALAKSNDLLCYTDGSASPNPGPSGAGVCLFNLADSTVTDIGLPLGFSTNNVAELVAIGLILQELLDSFPLLITKPGRVLIFTDSLYASSAVQSSKAPLAHFFFFTTKAQCIEMQKSDSNKRHMSVKGHDYDKDSGLTQHNTHTRIKEKD